MISTCILIAAGLYLLFLCFTVTTSNTSGAVLYKFIPFLLGLALFVIALSSTLHMLRL